MITLFVLSFIIGGHGAMQYQAEYAELRQFNFDSTTLLATFKWSDGKKKSVQMFAASPQDLEDCNYRGSFQEDRSSSILG